MFVRVCECEGMCRSVCQRSGRPKYFPINNSTRLGFYFSVDFYVILSLLLL